MAEQTTYQIYTFKKPDNGLPLQWDLHAVSQQRESVMLHAKMLSLHPQYEKIQVEKIIVDDATGEKDSKTIKVFRPKRKSTGFVGYVKERLVKPLLEKHY